MQTKISGTLNLQYTTLNNTSGYYPNSVHLIFLIILKLILLKIRNSLAPFPMFYQNKNFKDNHDDDIKVKEKIEFIKNYTSTKVIPEDNLIKLVKLAAIIEKWVIENELDGFAFQCWPSIQDNFGIVSCAVMSMFSEGLAPAACEVDISGLMGMLILQIASESPSAILDWKNN